MTASTTPQQVETCPFCDRAVSDTEPEHEQYLQLEAKDETGLVTRTPPSSSVGAAGHTSLLFAPHDVLLRDN